MPFASLDVNAHRALNALAIAVNGVRPVETRSLRFRTGELDPQREPTQLLSSVATWALPGNQFIYYFRVEASQTELLDLYRGAEQARAAKAAGRAYARLFDANQVFYVGSSRNLRSRLRQHLGYGPKAVYAMQLAHWARTCDVLVEFVAARYADDTPTDVVGALEDQLWSQFKPMMGRQGRK